MKIRYGTNADFDAIYAIYNSYSNYVGPVMPFAIRERLSLNECLVCVDDNNIVLGVCNFHILKKQERCTIYEIAVKKEARRKGIAKSLVYYIQAVYKRPIITKCIKDSSSEAFWKSVGEKIGEEDSRKQVVCIYQIGKEVVRKGLLD